MKAKAYTNFTTGRNSVSTAPSFCTAENVHFRGFYPQAVEMLKFTFLPLKSNKNNDLAGAVEMLKTRFYRYFYRFRIAAMKAVETVETPIGFYRSTAHAALEVEK
jgi:hypothetical protein